MLLGLSIIGILLSVVLISFHARKFSSSIYLGSFFFLISLYGFIEYVLFYSSSKFLIAVIYLNFGALSYLTGPLLYWYVRSLIRDDARLQKTDILHLIPSVIFMTGVFSYLFLPWPQKLEIANRIIDDPTYIIEFRWGLIDRLFPKLFIYLSRPVFILIYAVWSVVLFYRSGLRRPVNRILIGQSILKNWLTILFAFLFMLLISHILFIIHAFNIQNVTIFHTVNTLQILSAIGLTGLLMAPFFFPSILYGLPQVPVPVQDVKVHEDKAIGTKPLIKGQHHQQKFESEYLLRLDEAIAECMISQQPFLNPGFNLSQLSVMTDTPVHHLAIYFREHQKKSFHDFRNEWRIDYAKKMIDAGKANEMTLEAIGLLSGFSSRNTFLLAFKKIEGTTPQAFLGKKENYPLKKK